MRGALFFLLVLAASAPRAEAAGTYPYDEYNTVVGFTRSHIVVEEETLIELARQYGLGYNEIHDANPDVDAWIPEAGAVLDVPTVWVLPNAPRKGIVINLAEMRLYHYRTLKRKTVVATYPVGTSVDGFVTPEGMYRISRKIENPAWYVPEEIRKERPELPAVVPPGEDNPLGDFAMKLSGTGYFIHGTNRPYGIGRRVSHGCIRLYPEDIKALFASARPGTPVNVIYQPVKIGLKGSIIYIEVHKDYLGAVDDPLGLAIKMLRRGKVLGLVDKDRLRDAVKEQKGVAVPLNGFVEE